MALSRSLRAMGGRLVSYDPGTGVVMGTFRVRVLERRELESRGRLFIENVARDIDDCRLWVKVVPSPELAPPLRARSIMRISSGALEVLLVRLENYVYSLWSRGEGGTLRLVPVSRVNQWRPGGLTGPVYPCADLPGLLDAISRDLEGVLRSRGGPG